MGFGLGVAGFVLLVVCFVCWFYDLLVVVALLLSCFGFLLWFGAYLLVLSFGIHS